MEMERKIMKLVLEIALPETQLKPVADSIDNLVSAFSDEDLKQFAKDLGFILQEFDWNYCPECRI